MHLHTLWRQTKKTSCESTLASTLWHQNPKKSTIAFTLWRQSKKTHRIYQHLHSLSGPKTPTKHQHFHPPSGAKNPRKFINDCIHQPNKLHSYIAHTHTDFMQLSSSSHTYALVAAWELGRKFHRIEHSKGRNSKGLKISKDKVLNLESRILNVHYKESQQSFNLEGYEV